MLKLLQECKTWCGHCTSCDELAAILQHRPDKVGKIVKTGLAYYRHTHKSDMIARPELFKLIRITHEERLENLFILLSDNNLIATASSASIVDLPTDDDALQIVNTMNRVATTTIDHSDIQLNEMRITLWNVKEGLEWFVGYVKEKTADGNSYVLEHLEWVVKIDVQWKYPVLDDTRIVKHDQIMPWKVEGDWDLTESVCVTKFIFKNSIQIRNAFQNI